MVENKGKAFFGIDDFGGKTPFFWKHLLCIEQNMWYIFGYLIEIMILAMTSNFGMIECIPTSTIYWKSDLQSHLLRTKNSMILYDQLLPRLIALPVSKCY